MLLTQSLVGEFTFCDLPRVAIDQAEFGRRLREAREARGLLQKHLADATGKSQSYISQLERGEIEDPSAFVVRDLEARLAVYHGFLTEPPETQSARMAAITRLVREHGTELGISSDEETDLRLRLAYIDPGPNPPMIYLVKILELLRTINSMGKNRP